MQDTMLITDSGCDLPLQALQDAGVELLYFPYALDGEERLDDFGVSLSYDGFYDTMRGGVRSTTAQVRLPDCLAVFERAYQGGKTALLVTISSGLSGSYETALAAREQFLETHPDAMIHVMDSLSVSAGQGVLVLEMAQRLKEGLSADAVVTWAEENRQRVNHLFTVDSFDYLVRGGRVQPAVGAVGGLLDIKPILHVDPEGRLALLKKLRGRKKALTLLADMVAERIEDAGAQTIVLDHAQCPEEAEMLRGMLAERFSARDVISGRIGIIIGTHTGPSCIVVSFLGSPRAN
ncbi:MAG: DegV family protein [Actinomycetia bacterium]|nr:DegV family protein [Actinomycetes bacterium]